MSPITRFKYAFAESRIDFMRINVNFLQFISPSLTSYLVPALSELSLEMTAAFACLEPT